MSTQYGLGSGLGKFFNAISSGSDIKNDAYNAQLRQNLQDALLRGKAQDQQAQDNAYAALPAELEGMGIPAGQGKGYSDLARATGSKANELGDFFNTLTKAAYVKGAKDAMTKGDTLAMNFGLTAGGDKPLEMTKIAGNTAYNPNVTPDSQTLATTPYGTADLLNKAATDKAKLDRTTSKVIPLSETGMKAFALAPDEQNPFAQGIDTTRFAHFQEWAEDKGINDLNKALPKFLQQEEQVRQNLTSVLQQARSMVQKGVPAAKVRTRLEHLGVSDKDLEKAGL